MVDSITITVLISKMVAAAESAKRLATYWLNFCKHHINQVRCDCGHFTNFKLAYNYNWNNRR
jgi:hypothetical protein